MSRVFWDVVASTGYKLAETSGQGYRVLQNQRPTQGRTASPGIFRQLVANLPRGFLLTL